MKVKRIQLKNLASLRGEWDIDLTHPAYLSQGIFCISGPTGAGKSTLLDAITLALFGMTPRTRPSATKDSGQNEIMSKQTASCYARVEFEVNGETYLSTFEQHRAKKQASGALQPIVRSLVRLSDGAKLVQKGESHKDVFEQLFQIRFEQFTKSVLLPQGSFSDFLKASVSDRAAILEKLTGTQIYSTLSREAHTTYSLLKKEIAQLEDLAQSAQLLTAEQLIEVDQLLVTLAAQLQSESEKREHLKHQLNQFEELKALRLRTEQLADQIQASKSLVLQRQTHLDQCETTIAQFVQREAQLKPLLVEIRKLDEQIRLKQETQVQLNQQLSNSEIELREADLKYSQTQALHHETTTRIQEAQSKLAQNSVLKDLGAQLKHLKALLFKAQEVRVASGSLFPLKDPSLNSLKESHDKGNAEVKRIEAWIQSRLEGRSIEVLQTQIEADQSTTSRLEASIRSLKRYAELRQSLDQLKFHQKSQQEVLQAIQAQEPTLKQLRDEAGLRYLDAKTSAQYEEVRHELKPGQPCFLCGSKDHPYTLGNASPPAPHPLEQEWKARQADWTEATQKISALTAEVQSFQAQINDKNREMALVQAETQGTDESLTDLEHRLVDTQNRIALSKSHLKEIQEAQTKSTAYTQKLNLIRSELETLTELLPLGYTQLPPTSLTILSSELEKRNTEYQFLEGKLTQLNETLKQSEALLPELASRRLALQTAHEQRVTEKANFDLALQGLKEERWKKFEDKSADTEEQAFEKARSTAQSEKEVSQKKRDTARVQLQEFEATQTEVHRQLAERTSKSSYNSEAEGDLQAQLTQINSKLASLTQARDQALIKKGNHDQNWASFQETQKLITTKRAHAHVWAQLSDLIGSATGAEFRNYAQGLTLQRLIYFANIQLKKMSSRYEITAGAKSVDLAVIDHDQFSISRPIENLSGGETFIVSLALALGLSKMSAQGISFDSLFIDEGFGTLDEQILDGALDALSSLQSEGKLIGLISHIPAAKERISTQILVEKIGGGTSAISGPGVKQITQ